MTNEESKTFNKWCEYFYALHAYESIDFYPYLRPEENKLTGSRYNRFPGFKFPIGK